MFCRNAVLECGEELELGRAFSTVQLPSIICLIVSIPILA